MYHYKATTCEQMEKPKKENKFKQNACEEIRKLVEDEDNNNTVKEVRNKKKNVKENPYKFKLFD